MVGDVVLQRTHVGTEKETVMDLLMEELMMDIRAVREIWCVAATTARSLVSTITRRTTVVIFLRLSLPQLLLLNHCQEFPWNLLQVKDALVETTTARDAVPQRILVMRARETVMDLETEVSMTVTLAARETSCAAPTTVSSSEPTSIPRMIAVSDLVMLVESSVHQLEVVV